MAEYILQIQREYPLRGLFTTQADTNILAVIHRVYFNSGGYVSGRK
jgi:hypothetical protein